MKAADQANLRIDSDRLWSSLMALAEIGGTAKGGVCRIALTDLDRQGRDLFVRWAKAAGCTIRSTSWAACSPAARAAIRPSRRS